MKKILLIISLVLAVTLCACGGSADDNPQDIITVTDHCGRVVTLPKNIERIAVCDSFPLPSVISVFFNSAEKIVAMAPTSMSAAKNALISELYPEILNADTAAISGMDVNVEELMKLDPQVVFFSADNPTLGETLERSGFNAVGISASNWEYDALVTLDEWIKLLSEIFPEAATDRFDAVKKFGEESSALVNEHLKSLSDADKKKVFFLFQYNDSTISTAGAHIFGQWWADAIGAVNVGSELDAGNTKVTLEQVYSWNPDIILMTNFNTFYPKDLYENTISGYDWSGIAAVENKQVYKMPLGMYRSYTTGIDAPVSLIWLASTVYPEYFKDVDILQTTIDYYKEVFDIDLTRAQAEKIFAPAADSGQTDF